MPINCSALSTWCISHWLQTKTTVNVWNSWSSKTPDATKSLRQGSTGLLYFGKSKLTIIISRNPTHIFSYPYVNNQVGWVEHNYLTAFNKQYANSIQTTIDLNQHPNQKSPVSIEEINKKNQQFTSQNRLTKTKRSRKTSAQPKALGNRERSKAKKNFKKSSTVGIYREKD